MSRAFIFLVFLPLLASAEGIVFVGSPYSAKALDYKCEKFFAPGTVCMDAAYELEYRVLEVLDGHLGSEKIRFIGFQHTGGLPRFANHENAMLYVYKGITDDWMLGEIEFLDYSETDEETLIYCKNWTEDDVCAEEVSLKEVKNSMKQKINKKRNEMDGSSEPPIR